MTDKKNWRGYIPRIVVGLVITLLLAVAIYFVSQFERQPPEKKGKKIQTITLVKPPPPPPPPPPKVEKPPEPEQEKIEEPTPEPEPAPEEEPEPEQAPDEPAGDTGLDADGTAGSDSFGLVGRKGGRGLLSGGGKAGGSVNAWYGGIIKNQILDLLADRDELRRSKYSVTVKIWFDANGTIERYELVNASKDPKIDELLNLQLAKLKKLAKAPPEGVKSPVKFRITSRI